MAAPDMALYLRWLIGACRGQGGPLLSDAGARLWTTPTIDAPGWAPGARYANGLAIVQSFGRTLWHHTGGMVTFSSSLHVDPDAQVACFASTNVGSTDYRPRDVTRYACALFGAAAAGTAPPRPPPTEMAIDQGDRYVGVYIAADGSRLEIRPSGGGLLAVTAAGSGPLEPSGDGALLAHHPEFLHYALAFEPKGQRAASVWYGGVEFAADPTKLHGPPPDALARLAGRYDDGSGGSTRIAARFNGLFLEGVTPLSRNPDGSWRPDRGVASAERLWFDAELGGRPARLSYSGADLWRTKERA
jgi:hypothetical protein